MTTLTEYAQTESVRALEAKGVCTRYLDESELTRPSPLRNRLPLVVEAEPDFPWDAEAFASYAREHHSAIREQLAEHGGILFRGFNLADTAAFEHAAKSISEQLEKLYMFGTSPRNSLGEYVFSSTEAGPNYPILAHNELSYVRTRPSIKMFYCLVAPEKYGETPIFDSRAALLELSPELRSELADRGVRYIRRFPKKRQFWASTINRTWEEAFYTEDRAEIERICQQNGIRTRWDGRLLWTEADVPPIITHPKTGKSVLNVQLLHKHNALLDIDNIASRQSFWQNEIPKLGVCVYFPLGLFPIEIRWGDGEKISNEVIEEIRTATWKHSLLFRWKQGDLILLDNLSVGHGRMNVVAPRKVLAAFGEMVTV